jgi:hypothetical protein
MVNPESKRSFIYQSLDTDKHDIRLIRLFPESSTEWQTTIECELFHINVDELPPYETLSYVWGEGVKPYQIRVNGRALGITSNLFEALLHLRASEPRIMWVDAICIDQTNTSERNHQVALMRDIYTQAVRVNIWLGNFHLPAPSPGVEFMTWLQRSYDEVLTRASVVILHEVR